MVKRIFIALFIAFQSIVAYSQNSSIQSKVDERIELVSIVCRLAGYEEYNEDFDYANVSNGSPKYKTDIDAYFTAFKADSLIKYAREIRKVHEIGYDAPMRFAVNLAIRDSIVIIENMASKLELDDNRWTKESVDKFLLLLNKFYRKTNFHAFFEQNKPVYAKMEENFNSSINNFNTEWYARFFGEQNKNSFQVILSGLNGESSYGPKITMKDGAQQFYSIMGSWIFDSTLTVPPKYKVGIREVLIHEFSHSFCNPLIDAYLVKMEPNATKMFKCVKSSMVEMAYSNSKIMMGELLVRACVIKYLETEGVQTAASIKKKIVVEQRNGFCWIDTLFSSLGQYETHRDKYPTLYSYMPEVVMLINSLDTKEYVKRFEQKCPLLRIQTSIKNGDNNVNPDIKELVVLFDKKMDTGANGSTYGKKGRKHEIKILAAHWNSENKQEWVLDIKLEPNKEYSIAFPSEWFREESGYPGKRGTYYLDFKTKK